MFNASAGRTENTENRADQWGVRPRLPDVIDIAKAHISAGMADLATDLLPIEEAEEPASPAIPASFLDALPQGEDGDAGAKDYISAVNSDEAGIYRMFINLSP